MIETLAKEVVTVFTSEVRALLDLALWWIRVV
jgi:hypothetical protein